MIGSTFYFLIGLYLFLMSAATLSMSVNKVPAEMARASNFFKITGLSALGI